MLGMEDSICKEFIRMPRPYGGGGGGGVEGGARELINGDNGARKRMYRNKPVLKSSISISNIHLF
jgi:hypothetical protein